MIPAENLAAFALLAFAIIVVPGPSVVFVVSRSLVLGRRVGLTTVVGNAAGAYTQVVAVALGLGAVVASSIVVFTVIKLAGAAYLVYLGVQAIRHRRNLAEAVSRPVAMTSGRRAMRDGFVVGVANPKVIVFFAAVLPQFVDPASGPVIPQMLVFGAVFVAIALVSDGAWALAAGTAREWFVRSPRRLSHVGLAGGLAMIGIGTRLAVSGRPD